MTAIEDPVLAALSNYRAAALAKDVDAFVALYADDVHVFDMWGKWELRGIDAWRDMAAGWFSSLGSDKVIVDVSDLASATSGDLSVGHATLTYTAVSASGEKLRSLDNRISIALRRAGGTWKIFHEHTSGPIEHSSLKGIIQREAAR